MKKTSHALKHALGAATLTAITLSTSAAENTADNTQSENNLGHKFSNGYDGGFYSAECMDLHKLNGSSHKPGEHQTQITFHLPQSSDFRGADHTKDGKTYTCPSNFRLSAFYLVAQAINNLCDEKQENGTVSTHDMKQTDIDVFNHFNFSAHDLANSINHNAEPLCTDVQDWRDGFAQRITHYQF